MKAKGPGQTLDLTLDERAIAANVRAVGPAGLAHTPDIPTSTALRLQLVGLIRIRAGRLYAAD
jgi:hypothetical protein